MSYTFSEYKYGIQTINGAGTTPEGVTGTAAIALNNNFIAIANEFDSVANLGLANQTPNTVYSGPASGTATPPTFRSLVPNDIPDLSSLYLPLTGGALSGYLSLGGNVLANVSTIHTNSIILSGSGYVNAATSDFGNIGTLSFYNSGGSRIYGNGTGITLIGSLTLNNTLAMGSNNITGTGTITATTFSGSGADLTSIPNASIVGLGTAALVNTGTTNGTVPLLGAGGLLSSSVIPSLSGTYLTLAGGTMAGNIAMATHNISGAGTISATTFSGSGASLTSIPESAITGLSTTISGLSSTYLALAGGTMAGSINMDSNNIAFSNGSLSNYESGIGTTASFYAAGGLTIINAPLGMAGNNINNVGSLSFYGGGITNSAYFSTTGAIGIGPNTIFFNDITLAAVSGPTNGISCSGYITMAGYPLNFSNTSNVPQGSISCYSGGGINIGASEGNIVQISSPLGMDGQPIYANGGINMYESGITNATSVSFDGGTISNYGSGLSFSNSAYFQSGAACFDALGMVHNPIYNAEFITVDDYVSIGATTQLNTTGLTVSNYVNIGDTNINGSSGSISVEGSLSAYNVTITPATSLPTATEGMLAVETITGTNYLKIYLNGTWKVVTIT